MMSTQKALCLDITTDSVVLRGVGKHLPILQYTVAIFPTIFWSFRACGFWQRTEYRLVLVGVRAVAFSINSHEYTQFKKSDVFE